MPRLLPLLFLLCACPAARVQAQEIHRCVAPDGQTLFTDRRCEDVGAASRAPPAIRPRGNAGLYRYGCPRRLSELVSLLQLAVDSSDVNRLSSLYLWSGQSDAAANQVLSRLEAIVQRPLLDIVPMYPQSDTPPGTPTPPRPHRRWMAAPSMRRSPPRPAARAPGDCGWNRTLPAARRRAACCGCTGNTTASG